MGIILALDPADESTKYDYFAEVFFFQSYANTY